MDKTISWKAIDDKEKVRLVLEHVMGYFVLEETAKGYHTPDLSKYAQSPEGFHWPIAFWNTDGEVWAYRDIADNNVSFFDPLRDMNDAWKIVEKMVARLDSYDNIGFEWMGPIYKSKLNYFSSAQHIPGQVITGHMDYTEDGGFRLGEPCWYVKYADKRYWWIMTDTPQEAIIIAALRIEGVEIVP